VGKDKNALMGCIIPVFVFAVFFGAGLFALAGGIHLIFQGIKYFGEGFWRIFEVVAGAVITLCSPFVLYRISLKYRQFRGGKGIDKTQ